MNITPLPVARRCPFASTLAQTGLAGTRMLPPFDQMIRPMARTLAALKLALPFALMIAGPAMAQSADGYYHAVMEKPAAPGSHVVSSDVVWTANGTAYDASVSGDIPKRVCATLAQKTGTITGFTVEGKPLSADDLAYCNKHARKTK